MEEKINVSVLQNVARNAIETFRRTIEQQVDCHMQEFTQILDFNMNLENFRARYVLAKTIGFEVENLSWKNVEEHRFSKSIKLLNEGEDFEKDRNMVPFFDYVNMQNTTDRKKWQVAENSISEVTPIVEEFERRGLKCYVYKRSEDENNLIFAFEI